MPGVMRREAGNGLRGGWAQWHRVPVAAANCPTSSHVARVMGRLGAVAGKGAGRKADAGGGGGERRARVLAEGGHGATVAAWEDTTAPAACTLHG